MTASWILMAAAWLLLAAAWLHAERDRTAPVEHLRLAAPRLGTVTTQRDALSLDPDADICPPDWADALAEIRSLPEDPR